MADGANAFVKHIAEAQDTRVSCEWSDWHLVEDEASQDIKQRVEEFEAGSGLGPHGSSEDSKLEVRIWRIEFGPRAGGGRDEDR